MNRIHILQGPEDKQWANISEQSDGYFRIVEAWNSGTLTAQCLFVDLNTARCFLAGKWGIKRGEINLVKIEEELSIDERIVKVVRQHWKGMLLQQDMYDQLARLEEETYKTIPLPKSQQSFYDEAKDMDQ